MAAPNDGFEIGEDEGPGWDWTMSDEAMKEAMNFEAHELFAPDGEGEGQMDDLRVQGTGEVSSSAPTSAQRAVQQPVQQPLQQQMQQPIQQATQPLSATNRPNPAFWNWKNTMQRPNGEMVNGTNRELWQTCPDVRQGMMSMWKAGQALRDHQPQQSQQAQQVGQNQRMASPAVSERYPTPASLPQAYAYPQSPAVASPQAPYSAQNTFQQQQPHSNGSAGPSMSSPAGAQSLASSKKRKREVVVVPMALPPYVSDLDSAAAAREYLSRCDPEETQPLNLIGDDFVEVKEQMGECAKMVYDALLHPFDPNPEQVQGYDDRKAMYLGQQESATAALQKMLVSPAQQKAARASCILVVDAAIAVSEYGVSKERYNKHMTCVAKNVKSDDAFRIEETLLCSERLDAIIAAAKANKLVGKDILEGKIWRLAESPAAYLDRKFSYLRSNKTRQEKVEAGGGRRNTGKRMRTMKAEAEDDR